MVNSTTESVKTFVCFDNEISSELKKAAWRKNKQVIHCHFEIMDLMN
jgi:hypothetical protein